MGTIAENRINVIGVSSSSLARKGMASALSRAPDINVCGEAANRLELIEHISKFDPNIVIVSDDDNGRSCLELANLVSHERNETKILLLVKKYNQEKELTALRMGVHGVLPETASVRQLITCIRNIYKGRISIRRKVLEKFIHEFMLLSPPKSTHRTYSFFSSFSKREMQVMFLVGKGYKNKEISDKLFISDKTVKHYLSKIFKKLNFKRRSEVQQYLRSVV